MSNRKVGIVPHPYRVSDQFLEERIISVLRDKDFDYKIIKASVDMLNPVKPAQLDESNGLYAIIVVGGDGTFLGASRLAVQSNIPIIGVEAGKLGFLCQVKLESFTELADALANGDFETEDRLMLEGRIIRKGETVTHNVALNDIVVGNAQIPRMLEIDCSINDTYLVTYYADALITSTPTGSTAYSMAAGGPILAPTLDSMILTPICAHSLYIRPVVVPDSSVVKVTPSQSNTPLMATFDGQVFYNLEKGDEVKVLKYGKPLRLIRLPDFNFFDTLMKKFKWGFKHLEQQE